MLTWPTTTCTQLLRDPREPGRVAGPQRGLGVEPLTVGFQTRIGRGLIPGVSAAAGRAEVAFEAVASGLGVALLSAGNAGIYRRDDVVFLPVTGLPPSELAIAWRTADDRSAIRVFVDACAVCLCGGAAVTPPPTPVPTR